MSQPRQQSTKATKPEMYKVKVHRNRVDEKNKDLIITVTPNDLKNKREFMPGEKVELEKIHIDALKAADFTQNFPVPDESGINEAANPLQKARSLYGGDSYRNPIDGRIWIKRSEPTYIIETVF